MADHEVSINLTPIVSSVARILTEPYQRFVTDLLESGRITAAEVQALRSEILSRGDRLGELMEAEKNR